MILTGSPWLFALVLPVLAIGAVVAWRASVRREAQDRSLLSVAEHHGWRARRAAPPDQGVEVENADESWLLRVLHRVSTSNSSRTVTRSRGGNTVWSSPTPALPSGILIVQAGKPIPPGAMAFGGALFQGLLRTAVTAMAGGDVGPIGELHTIATGDAAFDAAFGVITTDSGLALRLLDDSVRAALRHGRWTGASGAKTSNQPSMVLTANGLRVALSGTPLRNDAEVTAFVAEAKAFRAAAEHALRR